MKERITHSEKEAREQKCMIDPPILLMLTKTKTNLVHRSGTDKTEKKSSLINKKYIRKNLNFKKIIKSIFFYILQVHISVKCISW